MNTAIATKKIALATLAAPVLAALAIGMAGAAHADNETANHPVNNRVNSYSATRGDLSIAPVGGGNHVAGPHSSDTGTKATEGANTQGGATVIRSNAAPRTGAVNRQAEIDKWTKIVTGYLNYGNYIDG